MRKIERLLIFIFALIFTVEFCINAEIDARNERVTKAETQQTISALLNENRSLKKQLDELQKKLKINRGGERLTSLGTYTITAYCSCEKCCGKWARNREGGKVIVKGQELIEGVSVAAPFPVGTRLMINGHTYTVQDSTAGWIVDRYGGRIVDVYFNTHVSALKFGKQTAEVFTVNKIYEEVVL